MLPAKTRIMPVVITMTILSALQGAEASTHPIVKESLVHDELSKAASATFAKLSLAQFNQLRSALATEVDFKSSKKTVTRRLFAMSDQDSTDIGAAERLNCYTNCYTNCHSNCDCGGHDL